MDRGLLPPSIALLVPTVLVIRQSRQIGLHEKESHLPDVSSVVTHTTSSEIVGFYDSSTFSLLKNFVIYLMSVKLFLERNKELLEKQFSPPHISGELYLKFLKHKY